MLIAYIDEVGEAGAYVSKTHKRYNTSPAFGYAGFILPADSVRDFSRHVADVKKEIHAYLHGDASHADYNPQWERKGSEAFSKGAWRRDRQREVRAIRSLLPTLNSMQGRVFYFLREKPVGTPGQVWPKLTDAERKEKYEQRTLDCLRESINRLCRYAEHEGDNLMIFQDMINEAQRFHQVSRSYAHIYSRVSNHPEMSRVIEAPAYIDSRLSTNIQFADWVAGMVARACERQLTETRDFDWIPKALLERMRGKITYESTLQFHQRSLDNVHNIDLFREQRPLFDTHCHGMTEENLAKLRLVHAKASSSH